MQSYCMQKEKKINQQIMWGLSPQKIQGRSDQVHENGQKLKEYLESIRSFSLCPLYSNKQLRKIHRMRKEKTNNINRKSLVFKRSKSNTIRIIWSD